MVEAEGVLFLFSLCSTVCYPRNSNDNHLKSSIFSFDLSHIRNNFLKNNTLSRINFILGRSIKKITGSKEGGYILILK